ncbi:MarR family winged helix-turn-helix transcriptional regulator [Austwickia sp. TVS 96-490-7B]|uniref:MarR family winged helix-turn-helix transcriptional regulator n=1 Tax=Austwickia sp. TVS 96-490-7B TaxID=2830843 RepID=UPI001C58041F|nr:MarR family transcriptional regulator [Austwickia sp. TVS 96-490-7B]
MKRQDQSTGGSPVGEERPACTASAQCPAAPHRDVSVPDPDHITPRSVTELVRELSEETQRYVEDVGRSIGHHRSDVIALGVLVGAARDSKQVTPTDLAQSLGLSLAATTALIDRLESAGHVSRRPHPGDRRKTVLQLTEQARATSRAQFRPLSEAMQQQLQRYQPHDLDVVAAVLNDLLAAAQATRPPHGPAPG